MFLKAGATANGLKRYAAYVSRGRIRKEGQAAARDVEARSIPRDARGRAKWTFFVDEHHRVAIDRGHHDVVAAARENGAVRRDVEVVRAACYRRENRSSGRPAVGADLDPVNVPAAEVGPPVMDLEAVREAVVAGRSPYDVGVEPDLHRPVREIRAQQALAAWIRDQECIRSDEGHAVVEGVIVRPGQCINDVSVGIHDRQACAEPRETESPGRRKVRFAILRIDHEAVPIGQDALRKGE